MRVIKTDIRRKAAKFAVSSLAALLIPAGAVVLYCTHPGLFVSEASESTDMFIELANANDADVLLYIPESEPLPPADTDEEILPAEAADINDKAGEQPDVTEDALPGEQENDIPAVSVSPERYKLTVNISEEREDLGSFTVHSGAIVSETFGKGNGPQYIDLPLGGQIRNCTDIPNENVLYAASAGSSISVELYSDKPQVLILHTHTTESYEPYEKDWYDESYTARSYDPDNGVVAVGEAIAEQLAAQGITVIHDCTIHDGQYSGAYVRSLNTAANALTAYPSIKVILDIHRDAIEYEDGTRVGAVTEIDGKKAAQTMVICAADDGTYGVPDFYENLHFAGELQQRMESMFPTLTRPILFQYCQYNQQLSPGALLIEVGSHGNSADQAVYSGELIGKALASLLTEKAQPIQAVPVLASVPWYFVDRVR